MTSEVPFKKPSRKDITELLTKAAIMHMVRYGFAVYKEIGLRTIR